MSKEFPQNDQVHSKLKAFTNKSHTYTLQGSLGGPLAY